MHMYVCPSCRPNQAPRVIKCDLIDRHISDYDTRAVKLCPSKKEILPRGSVASMAKQGATAGGDATATAPAGLSFETTKFVACGANNIRLYRLHKGKHLRFCCLSWSDWKDLGQTSASASTVRQQHSRPFLNTIRVFEK